MVRFWILAAILCAVGFALYYRYYFDFRPSCPLKSARSSSASRAPASRGAARAREAAARATAARRRVGGSPAGVEVHTRTRTWPCCDGVDVAREEPRRAGRARRSSRSRARAAIPVWSEVELGYRLLAREPARRRHGHERQDDDVRAARRDVRARPDGGRGRGQRGHAALRGRGAGRRARGSSASCRASSSRTCTSSRCESPCC